MSPPEPPVARATLRLDRRRFTAVAAGITLLVFAEALARRQPTTAASSPLVDAATDGASAAEASEGKCPAGSLPDDVGCIPVPALPREAQSEQQRLALLPGRSDDYADYETPIAGARAREASDGRGAFVPAPAGTRIQLLELEAQEGPSVPLSTDATGTLSTLHRVRRAQTLRHYVLVYGGAAALPGDDSALGVVQAPAAAAPGLTLWVRQLRHGVEPEHTPAARLLEDSHSLDCDPRNVLPARGEP